MTAACTSCGGPGEIARPGEEAPPLPDQLAEFRESGHRKWRQDRLEALRGPEGWPSVVGLHWLSPGSHSIGAGPENRIVLPEVPSLAGQPPTFATLVVEEGSPPARVWLEVQPEAEVLLNGRSIRRSELHSDATPTPTIVSAGSLSLRLIDRGGELALRIRDLDSPRGEALEEIPSWEYRRDLVLVGRFEERTAGPGLMLENVVGQVYEHPSVGDVVVEIAGVGYRLGAVGAARDEPLLLIIADQTNGDETYSGGRYLSAEVRADGSVVVDLNRLYNPPCVFTAYATCPLPPAGNRLPVRIEGGEKLPDRGVASK